VEGGRTRLCRATTLRQEEGGSIRRNKPVPLSYAPGVKHTPRRPRPLTADEQHVLIHLTVRPLAPAERTQFDELLVQHHYLQSAHLVGEHVRYVASYQGHWLALATWSAPALHLKPRDAFSGRTEEHRRRLPLLANNSRWLIRPDGDCAKSDQPVHEVDAGATLGGLPGHVGRSAGTGRDVRRSSFVSRHGVQGQFSVPRHREGHTAGWKRSAEDSLSRATCPSNSWCANGSHTPAANATRPSCRRTGRRSRRRPRRGAVWSSICARRSGSSAPAHDQKLCRVARELGGRVDGAMAEGAATTIVLAQVRPSAGLRQRTEQPRMPSRIRRVNRTWALFLRVAVPTEPRP